MYNWKLEFVLKCGKELTVYYKGIENNSSAVAGKMLVGNENTLNGFSNEDGTKNIFIKIGEIASASISPA
jgi:hypothetical protein